jgi:hypothetical protein
MNGTHVFGMVLLALAAGLQMWHARAWSKLAAAYADEPQVIAFGQRQFNRRTLVAGLVALCGVLSVVGASITETFIKLAMFSAVLCLALAVVTLAMADSLASRKFLNIDSIDRQRELSNLQTAIEKWNAEKGNAGDPPLPPRPTLPEPSEN